MALAHANCPRLQHTSEPILIELHCRAARRRRSLQNAVLNQSPHVKTYFSWERVMRLVSRSLTYSIVLLLSIYSVSSYTAEKYKLTVQATPADSTIRFANSDLEYRPGMEVAPGRYELVISREGYKPSRHIVTIGAADV